MKCINKLLILLFCGTIVFVAGCESSKDKQSYETALESSEPIVVGKQIDLFGGQPAPHVTFEGRNGEGYAIINFYHCDENYVIYEDDSVIVVNKGTYDNPHFKMIKNNVEVFDFKYSLYPSNDLYNGEEVKFSFSDISELNRLGYSLKDSFQNYIVEGLTESTTSADSINVDEIISFINTLLPESSEGNHIYYSNMNIESIYFATAKKTAVTNTKSFIYIRYSYDRDFTPNINGLDNTHETHQDSFWMDNPYIDNELKWDENEHRDHHRYYSSADEYIKDYSSDYDFVQLY